jgi:integrative and conjugative element protein (TIGR02256 family)
MSDAPTLWVHRPIIERLLVLPRRPWEIGGWLLGFWTADQSALFVTHATPPGKPGTPLGIRISADGHGHLFDEAWQSSGGHVTFLGDWHTHPGSAPIPSAQDRKALRQLSADSSFGTPRPLIAIVQAPRWRWSRVVDIAAWYLASGPEGETQRLIPKVTDELPHEVAAVPAWQWPQRAK